MIFMTDISTYTQMIFVHRRCVSKFLPLICSVLPYKKHFHINHTQNSVISCYCCCVRCLIYHPIWCSMWEDVSHHPVWCSVWEVVSYRPVWCWCSCSVLSRGMLHLFYQSKWSVPWTMSLYRPNISIYWATRRRCVWHIYRKCRLQKVVFPPSSHRHYSGSYMVHGSWNINNCSVLCHTH